MAARLRVLVVDDSPVIRELIAVNLQMEDFEVTTAKDGQAALDLVGSVQPHVITLDVVMPHRGGFETLAQLREDSETAHIPVVIVTSRTQPVDLERGEELGVEAYLTKPFEPFRLVEVVTRCAILGRARVEGPAR